MVRRDPDGAVYRRIAADLRARIVAGEFRPGDRLGFEKALAYEYDCGVWTIGNAIDVLRREGYVQPSRPGMGAIVAERPPVQEVAYPRGTRVTCRPATVEDVSVFADGDIEPGVWLFVVEAGYNVYLHRADRTAIIFY